MKKIIWLMSLLLVFIACKKDKDNITTPPPSPPATLPTLIMDNNYPDQFVSPPKSGHMMAQAVLSVTQDSLRLANISVIFSLQSGLFTAGILDSLYIRVVDSASGAPVFSNSYIKTPVTATTTLGFNPHLFLQKKKYLIQVFASAGNPNLEATILSDLSVTYWQGLSLYPVTLSAPCQIMIFGASSVLTSVNSATPVTARVSGNQKVETLKFNVTATRQPATLTAVVVKVTDATTVQSVEVFDGSVLIGSALFSGNTATLVVSENLAQDVVKTLSVKLQLRPVASGQSGTNVKTSTSVRYATSTGDTRSNDTLRTGSDIIVHKAVPTIVVEQLSGTLVNGLRSNVFSVLITAPAQGSVAIKQLGLPLVLADNGSDDTLRLTSPKVSFDGADVTGMTRISKSNGDTVSTIGEDISMIYVTPTASPGEWVVPAGTSKRMIISVIREGFDPNELDGFSLALASDLSATTYRFLNAGSSGFQAKLYSSASPPNGSAQVFNCIWSDNSSIGHSPAPGISSDDWFNGWLIYPPQAPQVWARRP